MSRESSEVYTIKVTNKDSGRVDIHKNLSKSEVEYIEFMPSLSVEVMEVNLRKTRRSRRKAQE